jgi:phosphohistidine phosphatase SixA
MFSKEIKMNEGSNSSIFKKIQGGGYILYLRHGETIDELESNPDLNNCATQRNLSVHGKEQAKQIGNIFREQKIPIQYPILTSPYCRTKDTGKIAFGEQNIEVNNNLANIHYLKQEDLDTEKQKVKENLMKTLETIPSQALNKVIICHNISFDNSHNGLRYMDTVVLKPMGQRKGYKFIDLISLEQFIEWSNESKPEHI